MIDLPSLAMRHAEFYFPGFSPKSGRLNETSKGEPESLISLRHYFLTDI